MRDLAGEVVFASDVCAKTPKVQICPMTFVSDCRFWVFLAHCGCGLIVLSLHSQARRMSSFFI